MATADVWGQVERRLKGVGKFWRMEVLLPEGWPDVAGIVNGRSVFIELKDEGDELRAQQRRFLAAAAAAGAECWVLRVVRGTLEAVEIVDGDFAPPQVG